MEELNSHLKHSKVLKKYLHCVTFPSNYYVCDLFGLECNSCISQHFETETQDLAGLEWSPNGCVLAVWDSCLEVR